MGVEIGISQRVVGFGEVISIGGGNLEFWVVLAGILEIVVVAGVSMEDVLAVFDEYWVVVISIVADGV